MLSDPHGPSAFAAPSRGAAPFAGTASSNDGIAPAVSAAVAPFDVTTASAAIPTEDVEDTTATCVEVMVLWDSTVLHVEHLTPPRSFYVGDESKTGLAYNVAVPKETLGTARVPLVLADRRDDLSVIFPPGTTGEIETRDHPRVTLAVAIDRGQARPSAAIDGGYEVSFPIGSRAWVNAFGLSFQITSTYAARAIAGRFRPNPWVLLCGALSLAVHAALLGSVAFFVPPLGDTSEDEISTEQMVLLQHYFSSVAEREIQATPSNEVVEVPLDHREGGSGTRAKGEEGEMGAANSKLRDGKWAVRGPADNPDSHLSRLAALREAASFGMIGLLSQGPVGDPLAPVAPFGRDESLGNDPLSAQGNLWGNELGEAFGAGGLGLSGIGEGGGGRGEGIGLGAIAALGHGAGVGRGVGFGSGSHKTTVPHCGCGGTMVSGRLPPEAIQRIIRQNFGRFRVCYENGLRANPGLAGRVSARFVIGRDGSVSNVMSGGSDLADPGVVSCVLRAFYGLSFPQPEGGIVTVTYPIVFFHDS